MNEIWSAEVAGVAVNIETASRPLIGPGESRGLVGRTERRSRRLQTFPPALSYVTFVRTRSQTSMKPEVLQKIKTNAH